MTPEEVLGPVDTSIGEYGRQRQSPIHQFTFSELYITLLEWFYVWY